MSNTTNVALKDAKNKLSTALESRRNELMKVLPSNVDPQRLIGAAITAVTKTPKLLECNTISLYSALLQSGRLGLIPDSVLGEAYLIPYGKSCNLVIGYKGLISLATRTGKVKNIWADVSYEKDTFKEVKGLNRNLVHEPSEETDPTKDKPTHFYAIIQYMNGGFNYVVMKKSEIDFIKNKFGGANSGAWRDSYSEMGKKTVLKRLLKTEDLSPELKTAIGLDDLAEVGKAQQNTAAINKNEVSEDFWQEVEDAQVEEVVGTDDADQLKEAKKAANQSKADQATAATLKGVQG
jgi:recombination protein RecT